MDQQAFRQLLSTPRIDASSSSNTSRSSFSAQRPIKKGGFQSSPVASNLLPRKFERSTRSDGAVVNTVKEPFVSSVTGETYIDRAEARRLGREDEDDIKHRMAQLREKMENAKDEDEERKLREEIEQLEERNNQSTIKKGLDMELLARQKAKLNGNSKENEVIDDDDLEQAYGSSQTKSSENEVVKEKATPSMFKPIGSSSKVVSNAEEDKPEYIWRDGKRLRKKKKKFRDDRSDGSKKELDTLTSTSASQVIPKSRTLSKATSSLMPPPAPEMQLTKPETQAEEVQEASAAAIEEVQKDREITEDEKVSTDSEDEGGDIFSDAGRWKGLDDSDSDDNDNDSSKGIDGGKREGRSTILDAPIGPSGKKDWFASGKDNGANEDILEARLPSELGSIVKSAEVAQNYHAEKKAEDDESESENENEEERESKSKRLEGFSDSILGREGVRYMLEKKDDGGPDKRRKRKRSKKGKGGYGSD